MKRKKSASVSKKTLKIKAKKLLRQSSKFCRMVDRVSPYYFSVRSIQLSDDDLP